MLMFHAGEGGRQGASQMGGRTGTQRGGGTLWGNDLEKHIKYDQMSTVFDPVMPC